MSARNDLERFISRLEKTVKDAASAPQCKALGEEAIRLIVKRTRLGYGVTTQGIKQPLKKLSPGYIKFRKKQNLSEFTTPSRSNLTFTGQLLDSMRVMFVSQGRVVVGPKGLRNSKLTNEKLAEYVAKAGRPFNNLSEQEESQLVRYYRRLFGDLVDRKF